MRNLAEDPRALADREVSTLSDRVILFRSTVFNAEIGGRKIPVNFVAEIVPLEISPVLAIASDGYPPISVVRKPTANHGMLHIGIGAYRRLEDGSEEAVNGYDSGYTPMLGIKGVDVIALYAEYERQVIKAGGHRFMPMSPTTYRRASQQEALVHASRQPLPVDQIEKAILRLHEAGFAVEPTSLQREIAIGRLPKTNNVINSIVASSKSRS